MINQIVHYAVANPYTAAVALLVGSTLIKLLAFKVAMRMLNE